MNRLILLTMLGGLGLAFAVGASVVARAEQLSANVSSGRYAIAGGGNFGFVVDQETGSVWRCDGVDVVCDKLRLEQ